MLARSITAVKSRSMNKVNEKTWSLHHRANRMLQEVRGSKASVFITYQVRSEGYRKVFERLS